MKLFLPYTALVFTTLLFSCSKERKPVSQYSEEEIKLESAKATKLLDSIFDDYVSRHPMQQANLGIKKDYDKWDDISDSATLAEIEISKKNLEYFNKTINHAKLDKQTLLSFRLFEYGVKIDTLSAAYVYHNYPVTQLFGMHTEVPSFLANIHQIDSKKDAEDYISRLNKVPALFDQLIQSSNLRAAKGIVAPKFVFPKVLNDCKSIISGKPFDKSKDSCSILTDFVGKVNKLDSLSAKEKKELIAKLTETLTSRVSPAYAKLIDHITTLEKQATTDDGAWKFPDGEAFYKFALQKTATTRYTPDEVFDLGQKEVARIHEEMRAIMTQVGFKGDLQAFFKFMKEDPQFYYENTPEGKAAYLKRATGIIDTMRTQLDNLFITKPKADIVVKAVEPFREKTAAFAFYQEPAPDGSRPGTFYVSTYDMKSVPMYKMEALAYHEGIPGHHMQVALAQEMEALPKFRKFGNYTTYMAYIEGWALYTEKVPKEMGFYKDPYSDFGRLSMELLRAVRLVVDAGIHSKKWTREQAIKYFTENTPNSEYESTREVERYIVWPSQATAYKIGMIKIQALREKAEKELGNKFDLRKYHDLVLSMGAVSLDILEEEVDNWIKETK